MNQFVPDWGNMGDTSRPLGEDDDLMELLWCNGHVVMQSQTHRKLPQRPEKAAAAQEDEAGLWFPFALADSLDKDIFSDLFCEAPGTVTVAGVDGGKPGRDATTGDDNRGDASSVSEAPRDLMPPPKSTHVSGSRQQTMSLTDGGDNAGDMSDLVQARTGATAGKAAMEEGSSSMLSAIGASICGSNQVQVQHAASEQGRACRVSDTARGGACGSTLPSVVGSGSGNARAGRGHEATVASSSGRSNGCFGTTTTTEPASTSNRSSKRKLLDTEDSESPSEDAESESAALERKPPQKLTTARRSRAAEVHNLSERRRRDRINEKMRALQELIPHCNKTDKASMLDEAIEYLKSLQMQVQMMWMGSGITPPVMFPSMHQYLPQMGPSMPRMAPAFMAAPHPQPVVPSAPQGHAASPGYHHHHMPGAVSLPEHYAHFLGVNHLQPPSHHHQYAQGVGYYPSLGGGGKTAAQQNPTLHVPVAGIGIGIGNGSGGTPAATANAHAPAPGGEAPLASENATHPNRRSG